MAAPRLARTPNSVQTSTPDNLQSDILSWEENACEDKHYNLRVDFWAGLILGFLLNLVATQFWELWKRYQAHADAKKLAGTWIAHNMLDARNVDLAHPMPNAGLTVIKARPRWWSVNSHVLDVEAEDVAPSLRRQSGSLVIDPVFPRRATRFVFYEDSHEISEQKIVISLDGRTLHVFPVDLSAAGVGILYGRHALCKRPD